ncbi:MAG: 3-phosphoglycerate dehydrogenase family protein [Bacilli bacterium]|jgi:D-3-phosphoglycerate dehydrogenase|nr:3-phosphoglycerate dehydrogenase family protein [Bacilli bacterium]MDD3348280.1 3-phosphoglycerate dehydrogenase family protein [Bacilli bacterium]MDD4056849.1 3-phosphoglycerate dehydrogenase family protein [Bacilli bacterium]MDY0209016.1 3-phosphoglycerate dehydrogenase family protein [Bacilli bacterium]
MNKKILCLNKISEKGMELLSNSYRIADDINNTDAILVRSASMQELELPNRVVAIARAGVGVNNIPLDKFANQGIVVFNTPGANANGVKELVLAGMLLAARDIVGGINFVNENKNASDIDKLVEKEKNKFAGTEIINKKIGVIGLGVIGVLVANACADLGMDVYGYDPFLSINNAMHLSRDIIYVKKIEDIYRECDYITLHVPLMEETKQMVNKKAFSIMKKGVTLLNFARDLIVNDEDLEKAIESEKIKQYVTDFPNAKTAKMNHVIAIPHLGASTGEAEDNCAQMAVRQIMDYLENGNINNSVNYPNVDAGICISQNRISINHKNIPGMINKFTSIINLHKGNITNMTNKSLKDLAYTIFDIDGADILEIYKLIEEVPGVIKIRIVK